MMRWWATQRAKQAHDEMAGNTESKTGMRENNRQQTESMLDSKMNQKFTEHRILI